MAGSWHNHYHIRPHRANFRTYALLGSGPDGEHRDYRPYTYYNAQHRQESTHTVVPESLEGYFQKISEIHIISSLYSSSFGSESKTASADWTFLFSTSLMTRPSRSVIV